MTDFYLKIKLNLRIEDFQIEDYKIENINHKKEYEWGSLVLWGDPIGIDDFKKAEFKPENIIDSISGHYYYLIINKKNSIFYVGNSLFGILPVYYSLNNGELHISNSYRKISDITNNKAVNKRFILENILFNYQLFNKTFYKNIYLLDSNSYIEICSNKFIVKKHTKIQDYFVLNPLNRKKVIPDLTNLFIENSKKYFPGKFYYTTLTGGFDGRTLTACGLYHKKNFGAFSFGTEESKDVIIAKKIAAASNLKYLMILLDKEYIENHSYSNGIEFIENSEGNASFARAHYLYAVKKLSGTSKYIITGNFGSEVFRAAHIAGEVISPNLYILFNNQYDSSINKIYNSAEFGFLNKDTFSNEWDEIKEDLKNLPVYNNEYNSLTLNQKFYIIVFEEIFRKYFGAEMVNQFKYLNNRTPFIDIHFFKELLKTELSGVYSDFFEHNPVKRYKGQILYGHIIKKAFPLLVDIDTDKGYKPKDLINKTGKFNITLNFIKKEFHRKYTVEDPYGVKRSYSHNLNKYRKFEIARELFNKDRINYNFEHITDRRILNIVLSLIYWYNLNK